MPQQKKRPDKNYIAVMGKIFSVVEYLSERVDKQRDVPFTQIFKELPYSRSTVHRILYSLEKLDYVEKVGAASHYRLTRKFFDLSEQAVNYCRLQALARPILQNLLTIHAETVNIGVLDGAQITYLYVQQSPFALCVASSVGDHNPVHCTAIGKAILAFLPPSRVDRILAEYPPIKKTPNTITRRTQFMRELASVRERGIAFDLEENSHGVTCVAAPLFQAGKVIAACSMSGPTSRMNLKLDAIREDIRAAALTVTRMLAPLSKPAQSSKKARRIRKAASGLSLQPLAEEPNQLPAASDTATAPPKPISANERKVPRVTR
jgi:DNA-binding IclR family transcriptional regulator